jgi:hypothetical protein
MVQSGENMEVAARVEFRVWLRNVAQVQPSAPVRCRGGFANNLTTTVLVSCGVLRRGDAEKLFNNIPYLLRDPLEQTHNVQQNLDANKLLSNTCVLFRNWRRFPQTLALL